MSRQTSSKSWGLRQRTSGRRSKRGSEIIGRGGANVAEILSDDQIRGQCLQHLGVDSVQTFAAINVLANKGIDFRGGSTMRHARMNDHGLGAGGRREVTFVADAHNFEVQSERKKNLGSRRQQRHDPHVGHNSNTTLAKAICRENIYGGFGRKWIERRPSWRRFSRELRQPAIAGWCRSFRSATGVSRDRTAEDRAYAKSWQPPGPCASSAPLRALLFAPLRPRNARRYRDRRWG